MGRWDTRLWMLAVAAACGVALAQDEGDPLGERRALDDEAIVHTEYLEGGPYFDRWYAWPLVEFDEPVPGLYNVLRDGKSGELSATLAVDCEAGAAKWEGGVLDGSRMVGQDYFDRNVPSEVARNVIERYCAGADAGSR